MRIGFNPNKDKEIEASEYFHQVIVPVYIPNQENYFKDSFQILKYCLESLFKTSHAKTYFTIVNNGSCKEVVVYLNALHEKGKIHEIIHTSAIGKLNAILKGLTGQNFELITITDADVLFLNGWQKATYQIFNNFSKAGAVSPVPSSKVLKQFTATIIIENIFSKKLKFTDVLNSDALLKFAKSIDNTGFYNKIQLKKILTIEQNHTKAVVGAGHFVATYRGAIFDNVLQKFSEYSLGGNSEVELLDEPVLKKGYWRLSTPDNYAYHMGNTIETWMEEVNLNIKELSLKENITKPSLTKIKCSKLNILLKNIIFNKLICKRIVWQWFLYKKGLTKDEAKEY